MSISVKRRVQRFCMTQEQKYTCLVAPFMFRTSQLLSMKSTSLQNGGAQELALRSSFVSKTAAAPPSKEDLAAMGEDGSGLSLKEMMKRFSGPSNSDTSSPSNGKPWETEPGPHGLKGSPARVAPASRIMV